MIKPLANFGPVARIAQPELKEKFQRDHLVLLNNRKASIEGEINSISGLTLCR
jgi:hypothetical protein